MLATGADAATATRYCLTLLALALRTCTVLATGADACSAATRYCLMLLAPVPRTCTVLATGTDAAPLHATASRYSHLRREPALVPVIGADAALATGTDACHSTLVALARCTSLVSLEGSSSSSYWFGFPPEELVCVVLCYNDDTPECPQVAIISPVLFTTDATCDPTRPLVLSLPGYQEFIQCCPTHNVYPSLPPETNTEAVCRASPLTTPAPPVLVSARRLVSSHIPPTLHICAAPKRTAHSFLSVSPPRRAPFKASLPRHPLPLGLRASAPSKCVPIHACQDGEGSKAEDGRRPRQRCVALPNLVPSSV
ncbi:hypothetical protein B0H14DRAFT_3457933 [Mycena olivaceomarginata]|nr:hypothetical protein B0H14DRAFT_3457933 [Mycena olivaceomarginata]